VRHLRTLSIVILHSAGDMNETVFSISGEMLTGKNEKLAEKFVLVPFCLP